MSKFFIGSETVKVSFDDGEWVEIKQEFTQSDKDYISTQMMQTKIDLGSKKQAELEMKIGKQATLERAIVAWSFVEDGQSVPVTPENISNLRNKYRAKVLSEIDRLDAEAGAFAKN